MQTINYLIIWGVVLTNCVVMNPAKNESKYCSKIEYKIISEAPKAVALAKEHADQGAEIFVVYGKDGLIKREHLITQALDEARKNNFK